jgi:hypothetical protein
MADPNEDGARNQPNRAAESNHNADNQSADNLIADSETAGNQAANRQTESSETAGNQAANRQTDSSQPADRQTDPVAASVALLPEPFTVNAEAVGLAAAAARAALRRTTGAFGRFPRPSHPPPPLDAFRAATEPLKVP